MYSLNDTIEQFDTEVWGAIEGEYRRQEDHVELIASENYASPSVLQAQGSVLTNKYAEGYPGKRYYGGCEHVDVVEQLAIDRGKKLFHAGYASLGMALGAGGHLTHGARVNVSGRYYDAYAYGLDPETEQIDYAEVEELAHVKKPKLIVAGASAYSLVIDWKRFRAIADKTGALLMADVAHYAGLIAAGFYPSPVGIADFVTSTTHKTLRGPRGGLILANAEHERVLNSAVFPGTQGGPLMHVIAAKAVAFKEAMSREFKDYQEQVMDNARVMAKVLHERGCRVVSGRTDCHMFLVDLQSKGLTGKDAEQILGKANITVNKNAVPKDPQKPMVTSGIRIGSPAMTTRGFKEIEAEQLANLIADLLDARGEEKVHKRVTAEVKKLCDKFPVYGS